VYCDGGAELSAFYCRRLLKPERLTHSLTVESDTRYAEADVFDRICMYFVQASPEIMEPIHTVKAKALLLSNNQCFTDRNLEDGHSYLLQDSNTRVLAQKAAE